VTPDCCGGLASPHEPTTRRLDPGTPPARKRRSSCPFVANKGPSSRKHTTAAPPLRTSEQPHRILPHLLLAPFHFQPPSPDRRLPHHLRLIQLPPQYPSGSARRSNPGCLPALLDPRDESTHGRVPFVVSPGTGRPDTRGPSPSSRVFATPHRYPLPRRMPPRSSEASPAA